MRQAKKRHLLIDALNLTRGGGVIVMVRLAFAFLSAGYRVTVLTARNLPETNFADSNVEIIIEKSATGPLRAMLYRKYQLNARAQAIGSDLVLSFNYFSQVSLPQFTYHINVVPFLGFKKRVSAVGLLRAIVLPFAANKALTRSTANIFESDFVHSLAANNIKIIRNPAIAHIGAEFSYQMEKSPRERLNGSYVTVTSGARHKRNDLTVAFFRRIIVEEPDAKLGFIGDTDAIRRSLSSEDLDFVDRSSAITFHGYVGRTQLYKLLAAGKALITFSELESFFMVAIEAMSVGCPVIAADNSAIKESVGTAGLVVPSGDVEAAVQVALKIDTSEVFAQHAKASREWSQAFEANACTSNFIKVVERVLGAEIPVNIREGF